MGHHRGIPTSRPAVLVVSDLVGQLHRGTCCPGRAQNGRSSPCCLRRKIDREYRGRDSALPILTVTEETTIWVIWQLLVLLLTILMIAQAVFVVRDKIAGASIQCTNERPAARHPFDGLHNPVTGW